MSPNYKKEPLVSIVVPVYSGDKYFDKCLESVLNKFFKSH